MISEIVDPAERLRDRRPGAGRDHRPQLAGRDGRHEEGVVGALELGITDASRLGAQHMLSMWGHPDQQEGPAAFAEKRAANWSVNWDQP